MASQLIYQFYSELSDYNSKIWRRFQVLNNVTMAKLGYIIMTMYEMEASHLFCFNVPFKDNFKETSDLRNATDKKLIDMLEDKYSNITVELISEEDFNDMRNEIILDAAKTKLRDIVSNEKERLTFRYDFGDGWEIKLELEKIIKDKDLPGKELPRVIDGQGYGIIEDCGGVYGLENIERAFKHKEGKEYEEYRNWLGIDDLDLSLFDIEDINFRLKKIPRIYRDIYEYELEPTERSMKLLMREYKK